MKVAIEPAGVELATNLHSQVISGVILSWILVYDKHQNCRNFNPNILNILYTRIFIYNFLAYGFNVFNVMHFEHILERHYWFELDYLFLGSDENDCFCGSSVKCILSSLKHKIPI